MDRSRRLHRREFLRLGLAGSTGLAALAAVGCADRAEDAAPQQGRTQMHTDRMPVVFVGHGSPLNAFEDNRWSRGFTRLGEGLPAPRAILAVSAHWYVDGTWLTADAAPRTIHDYYGFPAFMYEVGYPARGDRDLARRVRGLLDRHGAGLSDEWGLDHGTWSVLRRMYPDAGVPVVQLSIDRRLAPARIHELARSLRELRHDRVLILGSGNLTHNLADAMGRMGQPAPTTPEWARRYDAEVVRCVEERDTARLLSLWPDSDDGRLAHPSGDHWLPLLYTYGAADRDDPIGYPLEGFDAGSLSMRAIRFG